MESCDNIASVVKMINGELQFAIPFSRRNLYASIEEARTFIKGVWCGLETAHMDTFGDCECNTYLTYYNRDGLVEFAIILGSVRGKDENNYKYIIHDCGMNEFLQHHSRDEIHERL